MECNRRPGARILDLLRQQRQLRAGSSRFERPEFVKNQIRKCYRQLVFPLRGLQLGLPFRRLILALAG